MNFFYIYQILRLSIIILRCLSSVTDTNKMASCNICTDKMTKMMRKPIECPYCQFVACRVCTEKFLLENTIEPKCMSCNVRWNMGFCRQVMTKSFMEKEYRVHQTKVIEAEAEAGLPHLQHIAKHQENVEEAEKEIRAIKNKILDLKQVLASAQNRLYRMHYTGVDASADATPVPADKYTFPCPKASCNGHMDHSYKCIMCEEKYCKHCLQPRADDDAAHECNKDAVDTVKILRQNTKPCPKCKNGIYKTEGCDQMWCTVCHTCFSWKTGNIINGTVHNPHYYEYMRTRGGGHPPPRNLGDIPCGGMPHIYQVQEVVIKMKASETDALLVLNTHRLMNHIIEVFMPDVYHRSRVKATRFREWGIKYLRKHIEKQKWLQMLYKASKQEESNRRMYELLEALTFNGSEIFRQYCAETMSTADFITSMETLMGCYNKGVQVLNKEYTSKHTILSISTSTLHVR